MGRHLVSDRRTGIMLGFAAYFVGALLLYDAYENRGKSRPFWHRFTGGLV